MTYKWIGAMLIIGACGGIGFSMAAAYRNEEKTLRQLISALDFIQCELQYRLTPLPELCRLVGTPGRGAVGKVMERLARELESQIAPDVECCMNAALASVDLPKRSGEALRLLGTSLGRFDMEGQLRGLEAVRSNCRRELDLLAADKDHRLRGYQTLGLCAGAALAILFV